MTSAIGGDGCRDGNYFMELRYFSASTGSAGPARRDAIPLGGAGGLTSAIGGDGCRDGNYFMEAMYFSASIAARHPEAAALMACR